jgi:hypothetical protein
MPCAAAGDRGAGHQTYRRAKSIIQTRLHIRRYHQVRGIHLISHHKSTANIVFHGGEPLAALPSGSLLSGTRYVLIRGTPLAIASAHIRWLYVELAPGGMVVEAEIEDSAASEDRIVHFDARRSP